MTAATGTGRDTGRHKGREASARQAHQRAQHLGEEIRSRRGAHEADERIAQRLKIAIANLDRYAALPEADDVEPEPDGSGYDTRMAVATTPGGQQAKGTAGQPVPCLSLPLLSGAWPQKMPKESGVSCARSGTGTRSLWFWQRRGMGNCDRHRAPGKCPPAGCYPHLSLGIPVHSGMS